MAATSVYAVSVDSRSRDADEPDNAYTVQLQRTMDRVKSVQLGSFQFQDARPAFTTTSTLKYSEPVEIPVNTRLRLVETCRVVDKATNIPTETTRTVSMTLPPTLNKITSMSTGTQELTTESDHGLFFGATFYPEIGLRMRLVGGDFPQDLQAITTATFPTDAPSPVLVSGTVESPFFTRNSQTFTWTSGYLSEMTGGVGSEELRMLDTTGVPDEYHSYIHAPRPTLVELFIMLNSAATFMGTRTDLSGTAVSATFATPIVITTALAHNLASGDQVVIAGVVGNDAANGTFFVTTTTSATTFELDGSVGVGVGAGGTWFSPQQLRVPVTFGFDNEVNKVACVATSRVTDTLTSVTTCSVQLTDSLSELLGFGTAVRLDPITHATLPSSILRTIKLKPGTPDRDQLAVEVSARFNPLDFRVVAAADRTFHYSLPGGSAASLVIDFGRYSPTQFAEWMTSYLSIAPANMTVTYNSTSGRFTIAHNLGLSFSIDFTDVALVAEKMGFEPTGYAEASSFTSVKQAVFGVSPTATPPANSYTVIARRTSKTFTFLNSEPSQFYSVSGTSVVQVGGVWTPLTGADLDFAHHLQPGDILTAQKPTISGPQGSARAMASNSGGTPTVITTAGAHGLTTGDNITIVEKSRIDGTHFVTVTGATTFELDGTTSVDAGSATPGRWWTNVSLVTGTQKPHATYEVVVKSVWDASTGAPLLTLEPTASMFSAEDAGTLSRQTLGAPSLTDGLINLTDARRNVFMLHFDHPEGSPETFGFPPVAWPPSNEAVLAGGTGIDITKELIYVPSTQSLPVSTIYDSPRTFNLKAPGYILVIIKVGCAAQDTHTHSYRGAQFPIFAKLLVNSPYAHISEQMHFTTFAGHEKFNSMIIEFQNPDGSPVQFNGRPHNYTLLFTTHEDKAILACV